MNEPYNAYQRPYQPMAPYQQTYQPQYQQSTNSIFWVQGEEGAKAYLMAPNTVAWLMDRNEPKLYVKRTDSMGQAYPLETYRLVREDAPNSSSGTSSSTTYVTEEELERRLDELSKKFVIRKPRKEEPNG